MNITTATRRIVRTLNSARPGWRITFDHDGREIGRVYGPEPFPHPGPHRFPSRRDCGNRWTYREVQEILDEQAWLQSEEGQRITAQVQREMDEDTDARIAEWLAEEER